MIKRGFFELGTEVLSKVKRDKITTSRQTTNKKQTKIKAKTPSCEACGLYKNCLSPRMKVHGKGQKGILIVGEAPGVEEDRAGKQWQGRVGLFFRKTLLDLGIRMFRDCWTINAVNCRPTNENGNNRAPTDWEVQCCRVRVLRVIEECKPHIIVLAGDKAVKSVIGSVWKKDLGGITRWRGWTIPDREFGAWICPIFHPSYVMRQADFNPAVKTIWIQDLKRILSLIDKPLPTFTDEKDKITLVDNVRDTELLLKELLEKPCLFSFDYETTGIKPHASGHKILCFSVTTSEDRAVSFLLPDDLTVLRPFLQALSNRKWKKTAHNIKYEHMWTKEKFGVEVKGWVWDSMLAAHILDNRQAITGLKFQVYVNFGVADYSSEIEPYMSIPSKDGANGKNRLEELLLTRAGREKLLTYNALDSLFQYMLARKQMEEMGFDYFS